MIYCNFHRYNKVKLHINRKRFMFKRDVSVDRLLNILRIVTKFFFLFGVSIIHHFLSRAFSAVEQSQFHDLCSVKLIYGFQFRLWTSFIGFRCDETNLRRTRGREGGRMVPAEEDPATRDSIGMLAGSINLQGGKPCAV